MPVIAMRPSGRQTEKAPAGRRTYREPLSGADIRRLRDVAMHLLAEQHGWPAYQIAAIFDLSEPQARARRRQVRQALRRIGDRV